MTLSILFLTGIPIAAASEETPADGRGSLIAIIDSGFITEHESFILTEPGKFDKEYIESIEGLSAVKPTDTADNSSQGGEAALIDIFYVSEKIPFAYNYADRNFDLSGLEEHGTVISSAAASNNAKNTEHPSGTAPEAQLALMKVASRSNGSVRPSDVVDAIEDAILIGADVIVISVNTAADISQGNAEKSISDAISNAREQGIPVISAVGNQTNIGLAGAYFREAGISFVTTDRPDAGKIPSLAKSAATMVGSAINNTVLSDCFELPDGTKIPYSDSNHLYSATGYKFFKTFFEEKTFEFEFLPGLGKDEDLVDSEPIDGKLAVIERGEITFVEKCENAAELGAVGAIIFDNQPKEAETLNVIMDLTDSPIPAILISSDSAEKLRSSSDKRIIISDEEIETMLYETPAASSFSAGGVTSELTLVPDIMAMGEAVETASSYEDYVTSSSTTISAARYAGMLASVKQKLKEENPSLSSAELSARAEALLASSAKIMSLTDDGIPYSPRVQGSGFASTDASINATLLLTSNGKNKIECGQTKYRWFTFDFTLENLSDEDKLCSLDAIIGSNGWEEFTYSDLNNPEAENDGRPTLSEQLGKEPDDKVYFTTGFTPMKNVRIFPGETSMNLNAFAENGAPYEFILRAGKTVSFEISVTLDIDTMEEYSRIFENGFFTEGFIRITSGDEVASIPFAAFIGNWFKAAAFDSDIYDNVSAMTDESFLYRRFTDGNSRLLILGANPFENPSTSTVYPKEKICFSPILDRSNGQIFMNLSLLRDVTNIKVNVYSESGETVFSNEIGNLPRTYIDYNTGLLINPNIPIWDGRAEDNDRYIYPDGYYKIEISYHISGYPYKKKVSYPLYIDTVAPELVSYEFSADGNGNSISIEAADNFALARVNVSDEQLNGAEMLSDGKYSLVDVTGKYLYIEIVDYAMNTKVYRIDNPSYTEETDN